MVRLYFRGKVEGHPGELYPRVGFIVTNMRKPAENVRAFYNQRGTVEQCIKEGKAAIKWTRLSCRSFAANADCGKSATSAGKMLSSRDLPTIPHCQCGQSGGHQQCAEGMSSCHPGNVG